MAMQRKLWSINALSTELDVDRRTLSRDLRDLEPAQVKRVGTREEKRWLMADVLAHLDLGREPARRRGRSDRPRIDADMVRRFTATITEDLFPVILEYFHPLMMTGCAEDCGLTQQQGKKVCGYSVVALSYAIQHALDGDEHMTFSYPEKTMELIKQVGDESRAATTGNQTGA